MLPCESLDKLLCSSSLEEVLVVLLDELLCELLDESLCSPLLNEPLNDSHSLIQLCCSKC